MKKIVLAPNAMKECLTAKEASEAMTRGILRCMKGVQIIELPFSDGGDGLVAICTDIFSGKIESVDVHGPRGDTIKAEFCLVPERDLVAIEMAKASGLALLPEEARNPMLTSSYGTGQLIAAALDYNISHIIIGLGGSATNDGGVGMASALGARFLDEQGREVESTGGELHRIQAIDLTGLDPRLRHVRIDAVCDVVNGLTGPEGATRVYGAQKGATQKQIESLEAGMNNLAEIIHSTLGKDVRNLRGSGAAGGLGAGLYAFLGASLQNGVELMCSLLGLEEHLTDADLVLTAEGQLDYQIVFGKGPAGVAMSARRLGVPCFLLVGSIQNDAPDGQDLEKLGISGVLNICPRPMDVHESFDTAFENLSWASEQVVRIFVAGQEKCVD